MHEMNQLIVFTIPLAWLAIFAGAWLSWQLLRQNGRLLLRVEELENRLDELEFGEPGGELADESQSGVRHSMRDEVEFSNTEQGLINNTTIGGYFQIQQDKANPTNSGSASFANITISTIPEVEIAAVANASGQKVIFWPGALTNFVLQSTTNLASPTWTICNERHAGRWHHRKQRFPGDILSAGSALIKNEPAPDLGASWEPRLF